MDDETNGLSSPRPKFETKVAKKDRIYCQICLVDCEATHQAKRKLEKILKLEMLRCMRRNGKTRITNIIKHLVL